MRNFSILTEKIIELRSTGISVSEICLKLNVSKSFAYSVISKSGLKIESQSGYNRTTSLNEDFFQEIDTPEKAYWLGVIASDGHITKNRRKLSFGMKENDILLKFKEAVNSGSPVSSYLSFHKKTQKHYLTYSLQINSKRFCSFIEKAGIDHFKSKSFIYPSISEKYYSHFYRGLFDGDGSINTYSNKKKERYSYTRVSIAGTYKGLLFLMNFLEKNVKMKIYAVKDYGTHAVVNFCGDSIKFLDWIYRDSERHMRLDRKYEHYLKDKQLIEDKKPTYVLKNHSTGETFTTHEYTKFCREHKINAASVKARFYEGKGLTRGSSAGWQLISIKGRVPNGLFYL